MWDKQAQANKPRDELEPCPAAHYMVYWYTICHGLGSKYTQPKMYPSQNRLNPLPSDKVLN